MAGDVTVTLNEAEIKALLNAEWFRRSLAGYDSRIVAISRTTAPRSSGRGAASIHGEITQSGDGWEGRISWDAAHAYMRMQPSHAIQNAAYSVLGR
jgi:hypothetical protein